MCTKHPNVVLFSTIYCTLLTGARFKLITFRGQTVDTQNALPGRKIPSYGLYGEPLTSSPVFMHIEPIEVRSRAFNGEFGAHLHQNLHQVTWLASGQLDVRVNDYWRTLKGPSAVVVPALAVHSSHAASDADGFVLTVRQEFFHCSESRVASEIFKRFVAVPSVFTLTPNTEMATDISAMFRLLHREYQTKHERNDLVMDRIGKAVCLLLARQEMEPLGDGSPAISDSELARFLTLVDRYFASGFSLSEYAEHLNCQIERLIRIVRKGTGKSPMQLVHERRLREACQRLTHTKSSITEISTEVGFNDVAYFCRFFKSRIGSTPRQYRIDNAVSHAL